MTESIKTEEKIKKIIDEKINAQLALHNGSAELTYFEDGVAGIKFRGACASCMASAGTFEDVVKATIMENVPDVKDVVADQSVSEDLLEMARKILSGEVK